MTTERYFHYSAAPLAEVRDADFDGAAHPEDKPNGLWFSVESGGGGGWADWCRIDWLRVARRHDGIIIAPYVWEMRYSHLRPAPHATISPRRGGRPRRRKVIGHAWAAPSP